MMKTAAKAIEPAERQARFDHIQPHYLEALTLIERLHRRLLDVIKDEFDRRGRADINAVQALLLPRLERFLQSEEARRDGLPRSPALARRSPLGPHQADREGCRCARD